MSSPLMCARCGHEIRPGDMVEFVGPEDPAEVRIIADDDMLVMHAQCPTES